MFSVQRLFFFNPELFQFKKIWPIQNTADSTDKMADFRFLDIEISKSQIRIVLSTWQFFIFFKKLNYYNQTYNNLHFKYT